ncbi:MAG: response regulator, partial [Desulfatiglandaceae bacterium]
LTARKAAERTGEDERIELPINKGSDSLWIRVNISADRDEKGALQQWRMVLFDITEHKRLEEELNRLNAVLEQKVAQRTELAEARSAQLQSLTAEVIEAEERERARIGRLLHDDLQQTLAAAKLRLDNVGNDSSTDPAIGEVMAILQESITKSRTLSHELCPPMLGSGGLIGALEWLARRMEKQFGLQVELELKTEESISEPLRMFLFRAVQEFLFNVNRHAGTKTARILLLRSDGHVKVTVSDRGQGFDPEGLGSEAKNSGIGLMSIRERARYLGGNLEIETAPGEGSRFTVKIPFKLEDTRKQPGLATAHDSGSGVKHRESSDKGDKRVILVDDHDVMRKGLVDLLKNQKGIKVVGEAANGQEVIEQARQHWPDVILMDVSMPVIDGIEATRRIKMEMPRIRVIGFSVHEDEHTASILRKAGAEALITKSASLAELCKAIHGRIDEQ